MPADYTNPFMQLSAAHVEHPRRSPRHSQWCTKAAPRELSACTKRSPLLYPFSNELALLLPGAAPASTGAASVAVPRQ